MKNQTIDTLQWTPSERLRKVLFIKKKGNTYDKSFAEALTSAKRCYDVRIVTEDDEGITVYYLTKIGVDSKTGKLYMRFDSGDQTHRWNEPTQEINTPESRPR